MSKTDEEYQRDEYIIGILDAFIKATIYNEYTHETYIQAREDLENLLDSLFKGERK